MQFTCRPHPHQNPTLKHLSRVPCVHACVCACVCVFLDSPDGDSEPEGPGPGAAPGSDQAPLHHQHGSDGRDHGQVAAHRRPDSLHALHRGDHESRVRRGASRAASMVTASVSGPDRWSSARSSSRPLASRCHGCRIISPRSPHRSGMRPFRGSPMSRRSTKVCLLDLRCITQTFLSLPHRHNLHPPGFTGSSAASRPDAAEAGELLPDHHHPTDQPLHPVHRQGRREAPAQVTDSCVSFT